jgi:hypothetical protein
MSAGFAMGMELFVQMVVVTPALPIVKLTMETLIQTVRVAALMMVLAVLAFAKESTIAVLFVLGEMV